MKLRISIWAVAGVLVVLAWTLGFMAWPANQHGNLWALVYLTCPISLVHRYPLGFYSVALVNAATYALAGTVVEILRRQYQHTHLVPR
jgi:Na+/melibiose symporter-like transporter